MRIFCVVLFLVVTTMNVYAQQPAPPQQQQQQDQPELPKELALERENLLLTARVNELETQLAALRAQLVNDRIGKIAPSLIQRLEAAAPEYDVNPQTLQMTRKQTAAVPAPSNGAVTPSQPTQPRP